MSSSIIQRIARYERKLDPVRLKELTDAQIDDMRHRMNLWLEHQAHLRSEVLGVLAGETVISTAYPKYYAFACEVDAARRQFGGGWALVAETAILLAKWEARGCAGSVLARIRNETFAIPAPPGP